MFNFTHAFTIQTHVSSSCRTLPFGWGPTTTLPTSTNVQTRASSWPIYTPRACALHARCTGVQLTLILYIYNASINNYDYTGYSNKPPHQLFQSRVQSAHLWWHLKFQFRNVTSLRQTMLIRWTFSKSTSSTLSSNRRGSTTPRSYRRKQLEHEHEKKHTYKKKHTNGKSRNTI